MATVAERARELFAELKKEHYSPTFNTWNELGLESAIEQALLAERRLARLEDAEICDERYEKSMDFAKKFDSSDMQTMVDRALADAHEADRIRCAIRAAAEKEVL